ncbi:MAG: manganese efflux pump MntP family protein [Oscillospiraceae bacterium]|nr:manganese efflux pump MntP family protein [Oscillospiraceae bacterium]
MHIVELILLAAGLSMDAFAVAVCAGLGMRKVTLKSALVVGLYFGAFQALMPLLGYMAASRFTSLITDYEHWLVFALLGYLGAAMIIGSFKKEKEAGRGAETSLRPARMLPLALATSVDALAAGVSFAFLLDSIIPAALLIGVITLLLSALGVKVGNAFGTRFKSKAEFAGGAILLLMGVKVLAEHYLG